MEFKSWPDIFEKEKIGRKPNTLRKHDEKDPRFQTLKKMHDLELFGDITIVNKKTGESFTRAIQDITYYDQWVLISWEHPY